MELTVPQLALAKPVRVDVIVIGAGFWGTAITLGLRQRRREVLCLDGDEPSAASRAAGGLAYPDDPVQQLGARLPGWWRERHSQACLAFCEQGASEGWMERSGELFCTRRNPEPRFREGLWLADCPRLLSIAAARPFRVERIQRHSRGWRVGEWEASTVVLATGCFTDALLEASGLPATGVARLAGQALFVAKSGSQIPLTFGYRLAGDTRTRKATERRWTPGVVRIGDTLDGPTHQGQLQALRDLAGGPEVGQTFGLRPVLPQLLVDAVEPGLIVATGGHRTGLTTAGGIALRVSELVLSGHSPR